MEVLPSPRAELSKGAQESLGRRHLLQVTSKPWEERRRLEKIYSSFVQLALEHLRWGGNMTF